MSNIKNHERVNDILLGSLERPALIWLAVHMPSWVTVDMCTIIGVVGALVITISYGLSSLNRNFLWLASLGFVINWFGDSLDGTLARFRHIERPIFGFFIDHTVDAFSEALIFLGLGITPYINFALSSLALVGYLLLSVLVFIRTCVSGEFKISYGKLGPTEIRVLAIMLNTYMYFGGVRTSTIRIGILGQFSYSPYDLIIAFNALLLLYFFITTAIQETIKLAKANK
jgi:archaetidylinositol phosphate synthase